jgi:hypothetical protein
MEASDCLQSFGHEDFDPTRIEGRVNHCPVRGCNSTLQEVDHNKSRVPWCQDHGIRLHSNTFVYWNGPERNDVARLRNFAFAPDLARAIALPKGKKVESHRLGYEMSEDALSWNVFVGLAMARKLREAAQYLAGRSLSAEPKLYLWGRLIHETASDQRVYEPLHRVRAQLEPDICPFVTEPDIMLIAEGEMLICIEAKFGSGNTLSHGGALKQGEKPTSVPGLLERYLGKNTSDRTRAVVRREHLRTTVRSQLLRNVVFASEMAGDVPWHVVNLVSSTQANVKSDSRKSYEDPTQEISEYLHAEAKHCFTYRSWEALHASVINGVPELALTDKYLRSKSAHYRRAFTLS